jgi:transcriptional regulator with XRE-family HTH domain
MLTQEEYVQRVLELKRQGWSITEIAAEVGYHPTTVSKWLKQGGPPRKRTVNPAERVIDDRWAKRIDELIAPPSKLLSTSVSRIVYFSRPFSSFPRAPLDLAYAFLRTTRLPKALGPLAAASTSPRSRAAR